MHVVTSQFVMFISCALRARIEAGTCTCTCCNTRILVVTGYLQLHQVTSGYLQLQQVTSGYLQLLTVTYSYSRLHTVTPVTAGYLQLHQLHRVTYSYSRLLTVTAEQVPGYLQLQ